MPTISVHFVFSVMYIYTDSVRNLNSLNDPKKNMSVEKFYLAKEP